MPIPAQATQISFFLRKMIWEWDLNSMVDLATQLLPFVGVVTVASISGIAPRLGPGRAISIAFRSKVAPYRGELSERKELIPRLLSMSKYRRQYLCRRHRAKRCWQVVPRRYCICQYVWRR